MHSLCFCVSSFFVIGTDCQTKKVGITLRSEAWKPVLSNKTSTAFETLELKLLSAVSCPKCLCVRCGPISCPLVGFPPRLRTFAFSTRESFVSLRNWELWKHWLPDVAYPLHNVKLRLQSKMTGKAWGLLTRSTGKELERVSRVQ